MTTTEQALRTAATGFSDRQVKDALALIAQDRLHPVDGLPGVFVAIGSDGVTRYLVDECGNCQCPAAGRCYHGCAARLRAASMRKAA